jgi:hypothetical protein
MVPERKIELIKVLAAWITMFAYLGFALVSAGLQTN